MIRKLEFNELNPPVQRRLQIIRIDVEVEVGVDRGSVRVFDASMPRNEIGIVVGIRVLSSDWWGEKEGQFAWICMIQIVSIENGREKSGYLFSSQEELAVGESGSKERRLAFRTATMVGKIEFSSF